MDQVIQKRCLTSTSTSKHYNFPDLISDLPDSLLLHIMSSLDMEQVIKTSLLSRRWRYLWKSIPCLSFRPLSWTTFERGCTTNFIDKCLFHHEDSKIQKLHIMFDYFLQGRPALLVDSWIHFAITCKVEDLKLHFDGSEDDNMSMRYKLPPSLYFCGTLTSLTLYRCNLNLPDSFQLGSLKKLSLELYSDSVERLSSSCPLLEEIYLKTCNRERDLINIVITNKHVKRLEIFDNGVQDYAIKINAPTLLSLGIYEIYPLIRFHVEELESLISAEVIADEWLTEYCDEDNYLETINWLKKLLYELRHVKHLELCCGCIQVLSILKVQSSNIFSISATCLELNSSLIKWELPGISYLLQSCSNLEKLKIVNENCYDEILLSDEFIDKHNFEEEEYWASVETDLPSIMQNVKSIEIHFGGKSHHKEEFVRFSLKNAKVLERMVINNVNNFGSRTLGDMFKLSQSLNAFPRIISGIRMRDSFRLGVVRKIVVGDIVHSYLACSTVL